MITSGRHHGMAFLLILTSLACPRAVHAAGDLRLVTAAQARDRDAVRRLVAAGADVNTSRADGATPLMWAAHWNDLEMAELLLRAGARISAADDQGVTALALACENASEAMVATLLKAEANPNAAQSNGVTPLMIAARTGNVKVAAMLIEHGARVAEAIPATGQTALMWATAERHTEVMRALIARGADVHARSAMGFTPLLFATRNGDLEAANVLIAAGAGVNAPGADGTHPLPLAIVSGHAAFAAFLLEQGADPNSTMYGIGALHAAAGSVDTWLRDWLRARGASVDARASAGLDPQGRTTMVAALLARGADPNARITASGLIGLGVSGKHGAFEQHAVGVGNLRGATPLWVAAFAAGGGGSGGRGGTAGSTDGTIRILRLLLDAGADPNASAVDGTTALMVASGLGRGSRSPGAPRGPRTPLAEDAVRMLVEAGANVNAVNEARFTALHGAAFRGWNEVAAYLVERGAHIDAQDFLGRTAYRIARGGQQGFFYQEWPETAAALEKLGADVTLGPIGTSAATAAPDPKLPAAIQR